MYSHERLRKNATLIVMKSENDNDLQRMILACWLMPKDFLTPPSRTLTNWGLAVVAYPILSRDMRRVGIYPPPWECFSLLRTEVGPEGKVGVESWFVCATLIY
jgi:hypothetical protein